MAAPPQPPQINVNVDREQTKIPLFHADPAHDSFQAEYWIERLDRLALANRWTNSQTTCNAINSLRGDALHFVEFLQESFRNNEATTTNWPLFKEQFLIAFGKRARDTSSVANLAIVQRDKETVQKFAHRVVVTTKEFFAAMDAPEVPNFQAVPNNPGWVEIVADQTCQQVIAYYSSECAATIRSYLNKTIFLNGLKVAINAQVKNSAPLTWMDAVQNAIKVDRNQKGPIDHTIALEKSKAATSINFIKRGGGRGRARGMPPGMSRPAGTSPFGGNGNGKPPQKRNFECWYCRKPGHTQNFCKKRIARGADTVLKPKSVAEITADNIGYQDGTDEEDVDDEEGEEDSYLNDALHDDQSVDLINIEDVANIDIAAVHLN
jgi:hypothetical protein